MYLRRVKISAPKLEFEPGTILKDLKGNYYCINFCFRLAADDREWLCHLEIRDRLRSVMAERKVSRDRRGAREGLQRVKYDVFDDIEDAMEYFKDFNNRHGLIVSAKSLRRDFKRVGLVNSTKQAEVA